MPAKIEGFLTPDQVNALIPQDPYLHIMEMVETRSSELFQNAEKEADRRMHHAKPVEGTSWLVSGAYNELLEKTQGAMASYKDRLVTLVKK